MRRVKLLREKGIEHAVRDILKSKSKSRIYTFLLKKNGAKTEEIIKGTKLHPSTVRETLSKMHTQKLIIRKKIKNESIGKNPYKYYAISPIELLKRYSDEIEDRLNKLVRFASSKKKNKNHVKIKIYEGAGL